MTGEPEGDGELDLDRHPPAEHAEARTQLGEPAAVDGRRPATAAAPPAARRRWPWVATVVALVAVLAAIGVTYAVANRVFTPSHPVADLVGRTVPAARAAVRPDGFSVRQTATSFSTTVAAGIILAQTPAAATPGRPPVTAKQGTVIDVVVSRGPPPVTIPALTTFTSCNDAVAALAALHLVGVCPASAQQYSTAPVGAVLGSTPTGTAPYGSTVTIATSKGRAPVTVPAVAGAGTTYPAAVTALQAAGFVVVRHNQYDAAVPSGAIISSSPDPSSGPQPYGSTVTVNVSLGPKPVPVPFVLGQSVASAKAQLKAQGLKVAGPYGPPGGDTVITTDPLPGTQVVPGTTVTLYTI